MDREGLGIGMSAPRRRNQFDALIRERPGASTMPDVPTVQIFIEGRNQPLKTEKQAAGEFHLWGSSRSAYWL
jgi:hypothetical protein